MAVLSIGGPPGSGTTTVARMLRDILGLRYVYAGEIFRSMARDRGMDLESFGDFVKANPHIDRDIEMMQVDEARKGDVILEGRVTGFMLAREGMDSFKVYVTASGMERARRVAVREGGNAEDWLAWNSQRERNEAARYMDNYGFDVSDMSFYDLCIDDTEIPAKDVATLIALGFARRYPAFSGRVEDALKEAPD